MNLEISLLKKELEPLFRSYNLNKAAVFGSVAKGTSDANSDVDILISAPPNLSLLNIIQLKNEITDILGKEVDLIEYTAIKPIIRDSILKDQVVIYEKR